MNWHSKLENSHQKMQFGFFETVRQDSKDSGLNRKELRGCEIHKTIFLAAFVPSKGWWNQKLNITL